MVNSPSGKMTTHPYISLSGERATKKLKHCRLFRWDAGDCKRLHCERCGFRQYVRLAHKIVKSARAKPRIFFVTIYFDFRTHPDLSDLPIFSSTSKDEKLFRQLLTKVLRAVRDKARRTGEKPEYVAVQAFGKMNHRIHKRVHSHVLITWLPDIVPQFTKAHPDRARCTFLEDKVSLLGLSVWIEIPREIDAVARYTAANIKSAIGNPQAKNLRIVRFSQGFEKCQ